MKRRSFLFGAGSAAVALFVPKPGQSSEVERWRSYNSLSFEQTRNDRVQNNERWIDVDLRRMKVTGLEGSQVIVSHQRQLILLCDDGDLNNPSITGHFYPDSTAETVSMSGRKQLANGYKEYKDIVTHYVIFFANGYALHGLDPSYRTSGSHVSAGCIRLNYTEAQLLYETHRASPFQSIVIGYSDANRFQKWYAVG